MNKDEREKEQKLTMPCGDADIPEEARKDCYAGWTQWRDENEAVGDCADLCDYRAGFITGWQARAAWDGGEVRETEPVRLPDKLACGCRPALQKWCYVHQPADEVCECGHEANKHQFGSSNRICRVMSPCSECECDCRDFRPVRPAPQPDAYLAGKIARATPTWQGIDPDSVSDVQPPREDGVK